jgi:peptide chain release factor subunit 1
MANEQLREHEWVFEQLLRYLDGELRDEETAAIAAHLSQCDICRRRLAELRGVEQVYGRELTRGEPAPEYRSRLLERLRSDRGARRYDLVTVADLEALAAFHSDVYPVISLYLDVRPEERQGEKVRAKLKHLIDEVKRRPVTRSTKQRRRAFQHEAERLLAWFESEYDRTGRGLAIFTANEPGLWRSFRLPVPVRDRLIIADRPYLRPLMTLVDEFERYLLLLVDKQTARLFVVYLGEIEEYTELMDELVPRPKAGGWSAEKYQRHHDMHVLWHVKHAIEATERLWMRERCQWLLIGGTEEPLAELRRLLLKALHERLVGEIVVSVQDDADAMLARVLAVEQAIERRVEAERVAALLEAALGRGPGVLGLERTIEAVVEGRVQLLVMEEDFRQPGWECPHCQYLGASEMVRCPLCDTALDPQIDIVERAAERGLDQRATLEVLRGEARQALAAYGHIGAMLRYVL